MNPAPLLRPTPRALQHELLWLEVDRRVCFAAWLACAVALNVGGILAAFGAFAVVYGAGWWLRLQEDPAFLRCWIMPSCARWYDAAKHHAIEVEVRR